MGGRRVLDHGTAEEVGSGALGGGDGPDAAGAARGHAVALVSDDGHAGEQEVVAHVEEVVRVPEAEVVVRELHEADVVLELFAAILLLSSMFCALEDWLLFGALNGPTSGSEVFFNADKNLCFSRC